MQLLTPSVMVYNWSFQKQTRVIRLIINLLYNRQITMDNTNDIMGKFSSEELYFLS